MAPCQEKGCPETRARYNFKGEKIGAYCKDHRKENMVDITHPYCLFGVCPRSANYNEEGQRPGIYCNEHKKEGMININSRKCYDCGKYPCFNIPGQKFGKYCAEHAKKGMVDVTHRKCKQKGCKSNNPSFNTPDKKIGEYCFNHSNREWLKSIQKNANAENVHIMDTKAKGWNFAKNMPKKI